MSSNAALNNASATTLESDIELPGTPGSDAWGPVNIEAAPRISGGWLATDQIPLATVPNPNGLTALDNQAFEISKESGDLFFFDAGRTNASFGQGLPAEDVWAVSSRWVFNPKPGQRYIARVVRGFDQPTGQPDGGTRDYWEFHYKAYLGRHKIEGYFMQDAWGPYDFYRQFNITYPEQFKIDYSITLGGSTGSFIDARSEDRATRIGIRGIYRSTDENSPDDEWLGGENDYLGLVVIYFAYEF